MYRFLSSFGCICLSVSCTLFTPCFRSFDGFADRIEALLAKKSNKTARLCGGPKRKCKFRMFRAVLNAQMRSFWVTRLRHQQVGVPLTDKAFPCKVKTESRKTERAAPWAIILAGTKQKDALFTRIPLIYFLY